MNPAAEWMEKEASEMAGELLLPAQAAKRAAISGKTDAQVAAEFDTSMELARWPMNATGARTIASRAAQKSGRPHVRRLGRSGIPIHERVCHAWGAERYSRPQP